MSEVAIILKCRSESEMSDIVITIAMGGTKNLICQNRSV